MAVLLIQAGSYQARKESRFFGLKTIIDATYFISAATAVQRPLLFLKSGRRSLVSIFVLGSVSESADPEVGSSPSGNPDGAG
jgi:hypothetical protein